MNADYVRLAYKQTILEELRRHLLDKFIQNDHNDKEELFCDRLPAAQRTVTQEALLDIHNELAQQELAVTTELAKFDFRRNP